MSVHTSMEERRAADREHNRRAKRTLKPEHVKVAGKLTDREKFLKTEISTHLTNSQSVAKDWAETIYKAEQSGTMAGLAFKRSQDVYMNHYQRSVTPAAKEFVEVFAKLPDTDNECESNMLTAGLIVAAGSHGLIDKFLESVVAEVSKEERTRLRFKYKFVEPDLDVKQYFGLQFVDNFEEMTQAASEMLRNKIIHWRSEQTVKDYQMQLAEAKKYQSTEVQAGSQSMLDDYDIDEDAISSTFQGMSFGREASVCQNPLSDAYGTV